MATRKQCLCGCPKLNHKMGKGACNQCGMCDGFELDDAQQAAEEKRVLTAVAEVCEDQAAKARAELAGDVRRGLTPAELGPQPIPEGWSPDTLSTSARLAKAEQELVEAQDEARRLRDQLGSADARIRTLAKTERERDSLARRCAVRFEEAEKLRAELASARQEIEQLRAALAEARELRAGSGWIVARDGGRSCERCEREVRRGEAYEMEPGTGGLIEHVHCPDVDGHPAADVLYAYDALYCTTCYGRFQAGTDAADNHPHPLTPVRVSITHRTEGQQ